MHSTTIGPATLILGDMVEVCETIGAETVALIATDPPYGKVKGDFDHAWGNRDEMLVDAERWIDAMLPLLTANGTLYWFAWPSLAGRIEALISERMSPLAHIVWIKDVAAARRASYSEARAPAAETERILMFERHGAETSALGAGTYESESDAARAFVFEPLRRYIVDEWARAGLTQADANEACGTAAMARHYFTRSQWSLPTREMYERLQRRANARAGDAYLQRGYEYLRAEYEELRAEYEELRAEYEELRRPFNLLPTDPRTDVWRFPTASPSETYGHPTEKPRALMDTIVRISSRPGDLVLDPFMGSGTTGAAAITQGRRFIGIERDERYYEIACRKVRDAYAQPGLF